MVRTRLAVGFSAVVAALVCSCVRLSWILSFANLSSKKKTKVAVTMLTVLGHLVLGAEPPLASQPVPSVCMMQQVSAIAAF